MRADVKNISSFSRTVAVPKTLLKSFPSDAVQFDTILIAFIIIYCNHDPETHKKGGYKIAARGETRPIGRYMTVTRQSLGGKGTNLSFESLEGSQETLSRQEGRRMAPGIGQQDTNPGFYLRNIIPRYIQFPKIEIFILLFQSFIFHNM